MSLANIQGKLSRAEMKDIMAGSGSTPVAKCPTCPYYSPLCSKTDYCMNSRGECCNKK